jgi:hypothetical protein
VLLMAFEAIPAEADHSWLRLASNDEGQSRSKQPPNDGFCRESESALLHLAKVVTNASAQMTPATNIRRNRVLRPS